MAFIAGYVSARPHATAVVDQLVRAFSILQGELAADYEHTVIPTRFGHIVGKCKSDYPIKPEIASDERRNVLARLGFVWETDAATLLSECVDTSAQSLTACEGQFVVVFADARTGTVHIVNDRFSSRPFYVLRDVGGIYFSSNLAFLYSLARTTHRPDVVGWLQACAFGHTLGTRTTAEGVERLRPATHLTLTPHGISERQYWHLHHRPDDGLDPAAHAAAVFQAFRAATERRVRLVCKGVLALSGGLDSRLIAGALPRGIDYSAFTFNDERNSNGTPQTRAAAEVCAALGLRHRIEILPADFACPQDVIALIGGMRPYQHMASVMAYVREMRHQNARFLLGGGPGDSLAGAFIPSAAYLDPSRTTECIDDACERRLAGADGWRMVFRDDVIRSGRRLVSDALADSFADVAGPTAAHRVTAWAMVYRQPAFTFTSLLHAHPDVTEAACHLDYQYTDLMLGLPASWLFRRAFYSYMIYSALPRLRHVPNANTGALLSGDPPTPQMFAGPVGRAYEMARSRGRRLARRVVRSVIPARGSSLSLVFANRTLLDQVEERIHSIALLRQILDVRRCEHLIARTRANDCPSEEILGGLTSLCMSVSMLRAQ